ncbi:MAG: recombinase family protein [Pseudomonadota bacterium]
MRAHRLNSTETDPTKAVIYCRVSDTKQKTEGHGLESQESRCRDYARTNGYEVAAVFPDDVTGGGDFMKRPGMKALLSYLDAQPTQSFVVIFDDLKRFARDTEFHIQLRRAFSSRGARVECLNFKFEDTPEGKFTETIFAAQGELEREQNRRQTCQKMRERLKAGYWVFQAPVGYRFEKHPEHGKLMVRNEPLASIVQEALEGFASGRFTSQAEVQRFLEDQPAYPKTSKGYVHPQRVADLLTRQIYAGHLDYAPWGIGIRKARHEPIISLETYQKIQERKAGRARIPNRKDVHRDFVLRGAIACADCCVPYQAAWSKGKNKRYAYYVCQTKSCTSYGKSVPRAKLEADFEGVLKQLTPTTGLFGAAQQMFKDMWDRRLERTQEDRKSLQAQIAETERQSQKILDKIIEADSPKLVSGLEAKFNELEISKAILSEKIEESAQPGRRFEEILEHALQFLANPCKAWVNGTFEVRRAILKMVLTRPLEYHRETGPRTPKTSIPFKVLGDFCAEKVKMVSPTGFEPVTH